MNKQFILKLIAALSIILLAAGCNAKEADNNQAKDEKKEASAQKAEKKVKEDEPSAEEIFKRSIDSLQNWPGITAKIYTDHVVRRDKKYDTEEKFNVDYKMKIKDPFFLQLTGTSIADEEELPLSSYYKDKTLYFETPEGWVAVKDIGPGPSLQSELQESPIDEVNRYYEIIKVLESSGVSHAYMKRSEKDKQYIISVNLDKKAIKIAKDQIYDLINSTLDEEIKDADMMFKNVDIKILKFTFNIDKETFALKKMTDQLEYTSKLKGVNKKVEINETMDEVDKFTDDITVPDEIKEKAFKLTKQEFQEIEQAQ